MFRNFDPNIPQLFRNFEPNVPQFMIQWKWRCYMVYSFRLNLSEDLKVISIKDIKNNEAVNPEESKQITDGYIIKKSLEFLDLYLLGTLTKIDVLQQIKTNQELIILMLGITLSNTQEKKGRTFKIYCSKKDQNRLQRIRSALLQEITDVDIYRMAVRITPLEYFGIFENEGNYSLLEEEYLALSRFLKEHEINTEKYKKKESDFSDIWK